MEPKEHFDRVPKIDMVNMRFKYPPPRVPPVRVLKPLGVDPPKQHIRKIHTLCPSGL